RCCFPERSESRSASHDEGHDEQDEKHDEQNLGDARCGPGNATEAQNRSDDGDDQKCDSPAQHGSSPRLVLYSALLRRLQSSMPPTRRGQSRGRRPMMKDTMNRTRNTTNRILAMPVAVPAMPPKPRTAAMMAMIRNVIAQLSMVVLLDWFYIQRSCADFSLPCHRPAG